MGQSIFRQISQLEPVEQRRFKDWNNECLGQHLAHHKRSRIVRQAMDETEYCDADVQEGVPDDGMSSL